jgi:hypothetical protein
MKKAISYFLLPFLLVTINTHRVSAQKNLIEGYVITLKKDTLKGSLDYREWTLNPIRIHFKDANGKTSTFHPDDISGFYIPPKDYYISSHVSLDLSSFQTKDIMESQKPVLVKDTALFLLTIVKGKASLYYLKDNNDREHYYVSKDRDPLVELLLKKSYVKTAEEHMETHGYVATVELFKGQLIVLFSDCPALKENINTSTYSTASLRSLVIGYNECQHSKIEFVKKEEKTQVKFGVLVGPALTKISFSGGDFDLTGAKMTDCYSFLAGVSFHLIFPREQAQWSMVNELVYKPYSNSGSTSVTDWQGARFDRTFTFNMAYIKLYTMIRYQYPKWKIHPFADFGMSNGYAVKATDTEKQVSTFESTVTTTTGKALQNPKLYEFGILGGVGISWWKISGEFRYEWAQGMSPEVSLTGPENTLFFVVSYLF